MASRLSLLAGTSGTATVPSGMVVRAVRCCAPTSGGTLVITPAGGSALATVTVPEKATGWLELEFPPALAELVGGATLAFAGTDAYVIVLSINGGLT